MNLKKHLDLARVADGFLCLGNTVFQARQADRPRTIVHATGYHTLVCGLLRSTDDHLAESNLDLPFWEAFTVHHSQCRALPNPGRTT